MLWKYFWKRTVLLRFYALTPVLLKDQVFVDVVQCQRVISYQHLRGLGNFGNYPPNGKASRTEIFFYFI
jgi:hypothetical protein